MSGDKKRNGTANGTSKGTLNVFKIFSDIQKQQLAVQSQCDSSTTPIVPQSTTPFRTTIPSTPALMMATAKQADPVHVNALPMQNTSWSGPRAPGTHVHKPQVLKPGDSLALRKVQHLHNGSTCVNRLPLMKQDILSHYSGFFEGCIVSKRHFPGELYKFHLNPEHKPARHAPRKVPIHLEDAFKEEIKSLVELGILEEIKEHTDWVNSYVIVEKDSGNLYSPNHTIKRKLRICLDPRDLNEALEREKIQFKQSQVSFYGHCWSKQGISLDPKQIEALNHIEFPLDKKTMRSFLGMVNYLNRYSALSAHLAAPLSTLTHQAMDYKLGKVHYENFNRLKMEVSNTKALPYFDANAETTLQMDASKKGLGACLIQKEKVICYASRALNKIE